MSALQTVMTPQFYVPVLVGTLLFITLSPGFLVQAKKLTAQQIADEHPEKYFFSHTTSNDNVVIHALLFAVLFGVIVFVIDMYL